MNHRLITLALSVLVLSGCSTAPTAEIRRSSDPAAVAGQDEASPEDGGLARPQPVIRRGSGQMIDAAPASPPPPIEAGSGIATFNFEGE